MSANIGKPAPHYIPTLTEEVTQSGVRPVAHAPSEEPVALETMAALRQALGDARLSDQEDIEQALASQEFSESELAMVQLELEQAGGLKSAPAQRPAIPIWETVSLDDEEAAYGASDETVPAPLLETEPMPLDWSVADQAPEISPPAAAASAPAIAAPATPATSSTPEPAAAQQKDLSQGAVRQLLSKEFEEQIVHRVMHRVDAMLSARVTEAIDLVIEQQTRSLLPRLREEVEFAVRKSVYEAVADELTEMADKGMG